MNPLSTAFFQGFEATLAKHAGAAQLAAEAAPKAESIAQKVIGVISKRPLLTAATAAAGAAGVVKGVEEHKAHQAKEDARREQIRQLLIQRLSQGGYPA